MSYLLYTTYKVVCFKCYKTSNRLFRVLRSVEKFDPRTGSWTEVRSMTVARMAVACTKYREYIWVAGGMTGEKKKPVCKTVECYNSKTNE